MSLSDSIRQLREITGGSTGCGWMCDEVAMFLHSLVRFTRPDVVIQTGHLWGKSSVAILEAFGEHPALEDKPQDADKKFAAFVDERRPRPTAQKLYSIDPHPIDVPHSGRGIAWLMDRYPGRFEFHKCKSAEFFATFKRPEGARIFGVVDGDHSTAGCRADLEALVGLKADTIVVDDTSWIPSLLDVVDDCCPYSFYTLKHFPIYNGIALLTRA